MKVLHKKTNKEHFISIEHWDKLGELNMQSAYKVIDTTDFVPKKVNINPSEIEIFEIKLDKPKQVKKTK